MVKIGSTITGFLGSGKTDFYQKGINADYLIRQVSATSAYSKMITARSMDMMLRRSSRESIESWRWYPAAAVRIQMRTVETFQDKADLHGHVRL